MEISNIEDLPEGAILNYNWNTMLKLIALLERWGVNTDEITSGYGQKITAKTCRKVADAIEAHYYELGPQDRKWLRGHADAWRSLAESGGCGRLAAMPGHIPSPF